MKKRFYLSTFALILGLGFYGIYHYQGQKQTYITQKIKRGDITEKVTATGTIKPLSTINIGTQVSGTISEILVDYNSKVRKNQVLAQIDPDLFEAKVAQHRAALDVAKAQLLIVENDIVFYEKHLDRIKKLNRSHYSTDKELEEAQRNYDNAKAQKKLAAAQVAQEKALLNSAEIDLKYTRIVAPINGIVVSKEVEVGQTVAASFQTPTLFYLAEDLTQMQIETSVTEADIAKIKDGQKVSFFVDAYPNEEFFGTVTQVRNEAINDQNVITYEVIIDVHNEDLRLKPGMTANVNIITAEKKDVLLVPNQALHFYMTDDSGEIKRFKDSGIWIIKNGEPQRYSIKTLVYDDDFTEIKADVNVGDEVIVERQISSSVRKPMRLRVHK